VAGNRLVLPQGRAEAALIARYGVHVVWMRDPAGDAVSDGPADRPAIGAYSGTP